VLRDSAWDAIEYGPKESGLVAYNALKGYRISGKGKPLRELYSTARSRLVGGPVGGWMEKIPCKEFNSKSSKCKLSRCPFAHECSYCGKDHTVSTCFDIKGKARVRNARTDKPRGRGEGAAKSAATGQKKGAEQK